MFATKCTLALVSVLLLAVFTDAAAHQRKHKKKDVEQYPEDVAGTSSHWPGSSGGTGSYYPGGSGGSGGIGSHWPGGSGGSGNGQMPWGSGGLGGTGSQWPGGSGGAGIPGGLGMGSPGSLGSFGATQNEYPSDAEIDAESEPSGAERKGMSRRLREGLAAARRRHGGNRL